MVDTSNPVGAVTVIFAERLLPDAVNDCGEAAVPAQLLNAVRVPEVAMAGNINPARLSVPIGVVTLTLPLVPLPTTDVILVALTTE